MRRVPGTVLPDQPSYVAAGALHDAAPDAQARVQRDFVHALADVHALDWDALGLGALTPAGERGLAHDLDRAEAYVQWSTDGDVPTVVTESLALGSRPPARPRTTAVAPLGRPPDRQRGVRRRLVAAGTARLGDGVDRSRRARPRVVRRPCTR